MVDHALLTQVLAGFARTFVSEYGGERSPVAAARSHRGGLAVSGAGACVLDDDERLRNAARSRHLRLRVAAQAVVDGELRP
jgi:hypothetical protein